MGRKKRFDLTGMLFTMLFALAGSILCSRIRGIAETSAEGSILWSGLFLAVCFFCSLSGLWLSLYIRRMKMQRRIDWGISFILLILCAALLGAGGQFFYQKSVEKGSADTDIVLLFDSSRSMAPYKSACVDAAGILIDDMKETDRMQTVLFAGKVFDKSELLFMDESGKAQVKSILSGCDEIVGTTDFDLAFMEALEAFSEGEDRNQAIILLTDGLGAVSEAVQKECLERKIRVCTISIGGMDEKEEQVRHLTDFIKQTGGFETVVPAGAENQLNAEQLLGALEEAFRVGSRIVSGEQIIIYGNEMEGIYYFLIRAVVFGLCGVAGSGLYYGRFRFARCMAGGVLGLLLAFWLTVLNARDAMGYFMAMAGFVICIFASYAVYQQEEAEDV